MLRSPLRQRGLGLIELMVGITLAALLMTLAMPSFITGMQNRQIRTVADAVQNGLMVARTEALRRNRNVKFQLQNGTGWTVGCETVDASTDPVTGEVACPATIQTRDPGSTTKAQVATSQLVAATGSAASTTVFTDTLTFTPLGRTTTSTLPTGNLAVFDVTNPSTDACAAAGGEMRCLRVVVTSMGQVRMCDPAVTASTDPRKC